MEEIAANIEAAGTPRSCLPVVVAIDIKPGADPNCFNNDGHGVIPVTILGSADFDVTEVDASTIELDGLTLAIRGRNNNLMAHYDDVNGDGFIDLVVQIEDEDGTFEQGTSVATITGKPLNGTRIEGTDTICVRQ